MAKPTELWDKYPLDATPTYDFNVAIATATPGRANAGTPDSGFEIWVPLAILVLLVVMVTMALMKLRIDELKPFAYTLFNNSITPKLLSRNSMAQADEPPREQKITVLLEVTVPNAIAIGPVLAAMIDAGADSVKLEMGRR